MFWCVQFWATTNKAVLNNREQVFMQAKCPGMKLLGDMESVCLDFSETNYFPDGYSILHFPPATSNPVLLYFCQHFLNYSIFK